MRHLVTRRLWLQSQVADRRVMLRKVEGELNPADLMTKYHHERDVIKHLGNLGVQWVTLTYPMELLVHRMVAQVLVVL